MLRSSIAMRWIRILLIAGLFAGIVIFSLGAFLCEGALRAPRFPYRPVPVAINNLPLLEDVQIQALDGVQLRGSFIRGASLRNCIILLHGIGDNRMG